jgi:hypothetical protein
VVGTREGKAGSPLFLRFTAEIPHGPEFKIDEAGNGVFVDPGLLLRVPKPDPIAVTLNELRIDSIRLQGAVEGDLYESFGIGRGERPNWNAWIHGVRARRDWDVRSRVRPVTVVAREGAWRSDTSSAADALVRNGGVPNGPVEVLSAAARTRCSGAELELDSASPRVLDVICPSIPLARARLVDEKGAPLADWYVEARDGDDAFVDRAVTDAEGRFVLAMPGGGPVKLLTRRASDRGMPKAVLTDRLFAASEEVVLVLDGDLAPASIAIELTGDDAWPLRAAEVRLWRNDSNEGVRMALRPNDPENPANSKPRVIFEATGLLRGTFVHARDRRARLRLARHELVEREWRPCSRDRAAVSRRRSGACCARAERTDAIRARDAPPRRARVESSPVESAEPHEFLFPAGRFDLVTTPVTEPPSTSFATLRDPRGKRRAHRRSRDGRAALSAIKASRAP